MSGTEIFLDFWNRLFPSLFNFFSFIGAVAQQKFGIFLNWLTGGKYALFSLSFPAQLGGSWVNPFNGQTVEIWFDSPTWWLTRVPVVKWFGAPFKLLIWAVQSLTEIFVPDLTNYPTWLGLIVFCSSTIICIKFYNLVFSFVGSFLQTFTSGIRALLRV